MTRQRWLVLVIVVPPTVALALAILLLFLTPAAEDVTRRTGGSPSASSSSLGSTSLTESGTVRFTCVPRCDEIRCGSTLMVQNAPNRLPPGDHRCTASGKGLRPTTKRIRLRPGDDQQQGFWLERQ